MRIDREIVEKRMNDFFEACHKRNVKVTHQRTEIYRELASSENHPDAKMIYSRLKKRIPAIALDTVYRNLKFLEKYGLITVVGLNQDSQRFDANIRKHHHFVCVKCGRISDFYSASLDDIVVPEEASRFGKPLSINVEVKGICGVCGKKHKKE
ncbi:transcriptional repressor [Candidatus Sumerlaeota bacterium]|nr:transcriptional repressor [Candidatus Sumerlaeota bacterium]